MTPRACRRYRSLTRRREEPRRLAGASLCARRRAGSLVRAVVVVVMRRVALAVFWYNWSVFELPSVNRGRVALVRFICLRHSRFRLECWLTRWFRGGARQPAPLRPTSGPDDRAGGARVHWVIIPCCRCMCKKSPAPWRWERFDPTVRCREPAKVLEVVSSCIKPWPH